MHLDGCLELFLRKPFTSHARGKKKRIARTAIKLDNLKKFYNVNCGLTAKKILYNLIKQVIYLISTLNLLKLSWHVKSKNVHKSSHEILTLLNSTLFGNYKNFKKPNKLLHFIYISSYTRGKKKRRANAVNLLKARSPKNIFFKYYIIFYYFTESAHNTTLFKMKRVVSLFILPKLCRSSHLGRASI